MRSQTVKLRHKVLALLTVAVAFGILYSGSQRITLRPVTWLALEPALEKHVPINLGAIWIYFSLYPLIGLAVLGIAERNLLRHFTACLVTLGAISSVFFLILPTGVPRPELPDLPWSYRLLVLLDEPRNAYPSLHASLAVAAAVFCHQHAADWPAKRLTQALVWLWVLAIYWSCLALRQHTGIDLLAGAILGFATVWLALATRTVFAPRNPSPEPTPALP